MIHTLCTPKNTTRLNCEALEDRATPANVFALSGTNLLSFDTASPTVTQTTAITGITAGETLVGIDFRPQNGLLYGLGVNATSNTATLYLVSTRTGSVTAVGAVATGTNFTTDGTTPVDLPDPATVGYGFDFNPSADRIRVVAGTLNFRINPNTGAPVDGDNGTGNAVSGTNPDGPITGATAVGGAAYTNSQPNTTITTLYTLDAASNALFIQEPPDNGTQTNSLPITLGGNPLDFTTVNGFDIPAGVNAPTSGMPVTTGSAFAVLNVGGTTGLYSINLVNGQATLVGNVGSGSTAVSGLAVQSDLVGFPAIALSSNGANLLRFNTSAPGTVIVQPLSTGSLAAGEVLVGIDFRPATGQLYGLGVNAVANTATLYLIDPQTGALSIAATGTGGAIAYTQADGTTAVDLPDPATTGYGFDFNPDTDRVRITTSTGLNMRANPSSGLPVDNNAGVAGTQPDGVINGSSSTGVSGSAYTNSFGNDTAVTATTLYTLDATQNVLFIQNPPDSGTQSTPLPVTLNGNPLDFTDVNGFDIPAGVRVGTSNTAVASGFGYAVLTVGGVTGLYRIDLTTGAATSLGNVDTGATALAGFTLADAPAGTVAFTAATGTVAENGGSLAVTLTRTGSTNGSLTVTVNVTGGTATAGADFVAGPYTVTFADGATTATLNIPITDDTVFEGNETIVLTIASVNGGAIGTTNVDTVTITDNDTAPTVSIGNATAAEGSSGTSSFTFTVTLSNASSQTITVAFATADGTATAGSDYTATSGTLTFAPGETSKTITVQVIGDTTKEADETFTVTLSAPTNATIATATGTGTITNDDIAPVGPVAAGSTVTVTSPVGVTTTINPFPGFQGPVTTAFGDVNNDGTADVIVGASVSGHVKVLDGRTGAEIRSFFPFAGFTGGVNVAAGDINGDGTDDIIVGATINGHVKVFDGATGTEIRSFLAYAGFAGEVRVGSGDIDGDGRDDIITGAASGALGHVKVFSGTSNAEIRSFLAYPNFNGGVFVTAGDVNGDGRDDIITGADANGHVKAFSGTDNAEIRSFLAFPGFAGAARVASRDTNADGVDDIVVGTGPGNSGTGKVRTFDGLTLALLSESTVSDPNNFGVYVG